MLSCGARSSLTTNAPPPTMNAHAVRAWAHAVRMRCTCGVHAAAHRLTRGDVVLDEESDPHAAEEDPVDVPVDHRLVRV